MALKIISRQELLEAANAFFPFGQLVTADDKPGELGSVIWHDVTTYPGDFEPSVITWVSWPHETDLLGYDPAMIRPVVPAHS